MVPWVMYFRSIQKRTNSKTRVPSKEIDRIGFSLFSEVTGVFFGDFLGPVRKEKKKTSSLFPGEKKSDTWKRISETPTADAIHMAGVSTKSRRIIMEEK